MESVNEYNRTSFHSLTRTFTLLSRNRQHVTGIENIVTLYITFYLHLPKQTCVLWVYMYVNLTPVNLYIAELQWLQMHSWICTACARPALFSISSDEQFTGKQILNKINSSNWIECLKGNTSFDKQVLLFQITSHFFL